MKLPLITKEDAKKSLEKLEKYYSDEMIPAEKKSFLTDLKNSQGPYMAVESDNGPHYFMDAASQIATLGLGFSPAVFMGTSHFLESWTNDPKDSEFIELRKGFENFLKRKTQFKTLYTTFCHSGAEANEIALGYCYRRRVNPQANKVLAFEGSFHGRMLVSLSSTWNKTKREPFEWKGYETEYCFAPEDKNGIIKHEFPQDWAKIWDQAPAKNFSTPEAWENDPQLKEEVSSLLAVRKKLLSNTIFSIIIEPMQCEGGDRYLTNRFHSALILMANAFQVPIIHDEVQTGFHLGNDFFWHRELQLKGLSGKRLHPDYIVCAKKAQIGMVISHRDELAKDSSNEEFQVSSAIRGYLHALALDQGQTKIRKLGQKSMDRLVSLVNSFSEFIENPRSNGLAFSFDFKDNKYVSEFIEKRFDHGLLYYPAGSHTLRFRLNTAFTEFDLNFLFERLHDLSKDVFLGQECTPPTEVETIPRPVYKLYEWHQLLLDEKINSLKSKDKNRDIFGILQKLFKENFDLKLTRVEKTNYKSFENKIDGLQKSIYEPTRQTSLETFQRTAESENSICLALEDGQELAGIAFSAPLKTNPLERGVRQDPHFNNPKALYMIDTTISKGQQGKGIGRFLKYALYILAQNEGMERIHGRNRDRLAAQMMSINLSLGGYELFYLREDYPDFEPHRDVFYYTSPLTWKRPELNLADMELSPLGYGDIDQEYIKEQLPYIVNKVCLSNFVSERFLEHLTFNFGLIHEDLRHGYSTSGQSECVDKIVKSLYFMDENSTRNRMLTFKGHYFGQGSFLSRSLSSSEDNFFPVSHMDHPHEKNYKDILEKLTKELATGDYLSVWIEPIRQNFMDSVPHDFLKGLRELCTKHQVSLVYNETNSGFYKYHESHFYASNLNDITPDCTMVYMGGQAGQVCLKKNLFLAKPLMLISTWDGDEFSYSNFHRAAEFATQNSKKFLLTRQSFEKKLINEVKKYQFKSIEIKNGIGWFSGNFPTSLTCFFEKRNGRYLVNPTHSSMNRFIKSEY